MSRFRRAVRDVVPPRLLGRPLAYLAAEVGRWSDRRAGVVLAYHRVGDPQGDPVHELVPALGTSLFEAQVRYLGTRYRVVPASDVYDAARTRRRGERFPVAITFDDDLPSHASTAAPILERAGLPATFFLCGASLEAPHTFWWERLQMAVDNGRSPAAVASTVLEKEDPRYTDPWAIHELGRDIQAIEHPKRDAVAEQLLSLSGPPPNGAGLRGEAVRSLATRGFEIGFHTFRHDWLPGLDDDALARAMHDGRARLEAAAGRPVTTIAYPHGGSDARVAAAASAAGYSVGFKTASEAIGAQTDRMLIGRVEPSFESLGHFAYQVAVALTRGRWAP